MSYVFSEADEFGKDYADEDSDTGDSGGENGKQHQFKHKVNRTTLTLSNLLTTFIRTVIL